MPGVPAFVAVLIAAGATLVGILICAASGHELTRTFSICYFAGCVVAAVVVRYRGLFTAVVQPPLLLFVAVPLAYQFMSDETGTSIRDILLNVAIPLVNRFPLMLFTTLVTLVIGGYRAYLAHSGPAVANKPTSRIRSARKAARRADSAGEATENSARARRKERESAPPRSAANPTTGQTAGSRARDSRQAPRPTQNRHRTAPTEQTDHFGASRAAQNVPARDLRTPPRRTSSDVPAHPVPQVRYRDREGLANEA